MTTLAEDKGGDPTEDGRRMAALEDELRRLREEHAEMRAQLAAIAATERFRDVILQRHPALPNPLPVAAALDARDFIEQGEGFYYLEANPDGPAYRWTGPGHTARVTFLVDRTRPLMVTLGLVSPGRHAAGEDRITVEADGVTYGTEPVEGSGIVLRAGPIPPRATPGATELVVYTPVLFSPESVEDHRRLGIAISRIEVAPA